MMMNEASRRLLKLAVPLAACWLLVTAFVPLRLGGAEDDKYETLQPPDVLPKNLGQLDTAAAARQIVARTNEFRVAQKREKVTTSDELTATARDFARYMARTLRYGHEADDRTPAERAKQHDYAYCIVLENIAYQYNSEGFMVDELTSAFVEGWEKSPEHRENMLDPDVTETGVAVVESKETGYFFAVQMFGRPRSQRIQVEVENKADVPITYQLDDREFKLVPRQIRTHERCRPPVLTVEWGAATKQPPQRLRLPAGGHFVIERAKAGQLTLKSLDAQD
jgi:uncharacterized protein YkwD